MSRYIDTKWLEDNAKEYSLGYYEEDEWATPLNVLDSAPSIDIVCCEKCKYTDGEPPIADGRSWCVLHGSFMYYCSDGKRSSE